jgi:membrane associated rhomboid family serine protease
VVFIPLSDDNPLRSIRFQWVTVGLIAANVLVFLWQSAGLGETAAASFALVPSELFQVKIFGGPARGPLDTLAVPEGYTLLTYMFLHGDILHLSSNMLFLWVFGDNIEDAMGHMRFIMFYLMCGIFAAVLHSWMNPTSDLPLIGASGAVAGVIAAYLILHPKVKVWVLALWRIPIRITAVWALGIWIAAQFGNLLFESEENVAWWAHIGGLLAGATLILFMRRRGVVLFDKTRGGA